MLRRALAQGGGTRVLDADLTEIAGETIRRHGLSGRAAQLATEGLVATVLLSAHIKGQERMLVQVQGESPRFAFTAEARSEGRIRARLTPNSVGEGELEGTLVAIKHDAHRETYRGVARLQGSFAASLQHYLLQSQQTEGQVRIEGPVGRLVERMPGAAPSSDELDPLTVLEQTSLRFECTCNVDRVERTLQALGPEDLRSLAEEKGCGEVTCHFCNECYVVPKERLLELAQETEQLIPS